MAVFEFDSQQIRTSGLTGTRWPLALLVVGGLCCTNQGPVERVGTGAPPAMAPASNSTAIVPVASTPAAPPPATQPPANPGAVAPPAGAVDPAFTKEALLAAVAACAGERFSDFQTKATALKAAVDAWAAAPSDMVAADGARAAWKLAMASWQEAELFRIGPAAAMFVGGPMIPGGKNARNEIYGFPNRNTCAIDTHLANDTFKNFASVAYDARGLGAIEYLAFNIGTMNTCTGAQATAIMTSWGGLGTMLPARRAAYSAAAAADLVTRSTQLVADWATAGAALAAGTAPYSGQGAAFQAVSDAMFYVDKELKDFKLGRVLRISNDCVMATPGVACGPDAIESRIAGVSTDNIRHNLRGFRRIFEGCGDAGAGLGIDAWLKAMNFTDLATRMQAALTDAQTTADSAPALETAATADVASVTNLHTKIKTLTDLMKTEFLSMLELMPPPVMTPAATAAPTPAPSAGAPAGGASGGGTGGRGAAGRGGVMPGFPGGFDGD